MASITDIKNLVTTNITQQGASDRITGLEVRQVVNSVIDFIAKEYVFNSEIPFGSLNGKMASHTVSGPIAFTINNNNLTPMAATIVRLFADGINVPDFSEFKLSTNSSTYVNINGTVNCILFFYDGVDYWVNMWQEKSLNFVDVVFDDLEVGVSFDMSTKVLTSDTGGNGAYVSTSYTMTNDFELVHELLSTGCILAISNVNDGIFTWPTNQNIIAGMYQYIGPGFPNGIYLAETISGNGANIIAPTVAGSFVKMKKVGNDLIFSSSTDGINYTTFHTLPNKLIGVTNFYIKAIMTEPGLLKAKIKL
jgi:hypothetical protein